MQQYLFEFVPEAIPFHMNPTLSEAIKIGGGTVVEEDLATNKAKVYVTTVGWLWVSKDWIREKAKTEAV